MTIVGKMPQFPGGEEEMFNFIRKHLIYPSLAKETGIYGTVVLQFVVDSSGKIVNIVVLKSIGGGCEDAAIEVLKKMPDWSPGKQNGYPVSIQMSIPIKFVLK